MMKTTICLAILGTCLGAAVLPWAGPAAGTVLPTPPPLLGEVQLLDHIKKLERRLEVVEGVYIRQAAIETRLNNLERRLADLVASHKANSVLWKLLFLEQHDAFGRHVLYPASQITIQGADANGESTFQARFDAVWQHIDAIKAENVREGSRLDALLQKSRPQPTSESNQPNRFSGLLQEIRGPEPNADSTRRQ